MKMIFCALAQSVYSYEISVWGGTYDCHLKLFDTTVNALLKLLKINSIVLAPKLFIMNITF